MHDLGGLFCETGSIWKIRKIAGQKKHVTGWIWNRAGELLTLGLGPFGEETGWWRGWASTSCWAAKKHKTRPAQALDRDAVAAGALL